MKYGFIIAACTEEIWKTHICFKILNIFLVIRAFKISRGEQI